MTPARPAVRTRRRLVAAALLAAILLAWAAKPPVPEERSGPTAPRGKVAASLGRPTAVRTPRATPSATTQEALVHDGALPDRLAAPARRARVDAARVARRFLAAFLAYEIGRPGPRTKRELRACALPALARALLAAPPRVQRRAARARVSRLELYGPSAGRMKALTRLRRRGRHPAVLELGLRRSPRGWRVAALR